MGGADVGQKTKLFERVEYLNSAAEGLDAARRAWAMLAVEAAYEVEPMEEGAAGSLLREMDTALDECRGDLRRASRCEGWMVRP